MRPVWKAFIDNLSPLTLSTDYPYSKTNEKPIWIKALPPIIQGNANRRPDPNTMPVWFFDLCNLESDPKMLAIANATYDGLFPRGY